MRITAITYAGHSSVFLKTDNGSVALDPWIKHNPACPPGFKVPEDLKLIVLSHGHADHAEDAPHLCRETGAKVAATFELASIMQEEGVPAANVIGMNRGGTFVMDGLEIGLTTAFHSSSYTTAHGTVYAGEACGITVSDGKTCIYHSGDTALFSDMKLIGEQYHPTYALLPIGDHFTMGPRQAAEAASLVGCKAVIPIHYRTFEVLTGTLEEFRSECSKKGIEVIELAPGRTLEV